MKDDLARADLKIEVEEVYKIFGDASDAAVDALRGDRGKQSLLEETAQVVAIQDASFAVRRGDLFLSLLVCPDS